MKKKDLQRSSADIEINETDLEFMKNPGDENVDDPFLHSLDKLSERDIPEGKAVNAVTKKKKKSSPVTTILLIISCAIFIGCAIYLVINMADKKKHGDIYSDMAEEYFGNISFSENVAGTDLADDDSAVGRLGKIYSASRVLCLSDRLALGSNIATGNYDEQLQNMRASLTALKEQNSETYGWIKVEGTRINHPITQSTDNDKYLNYAYHGGYSVIGSIFADFRNSPNVYRNFNTVLYGHNITSGDMFHDVEKFLEEDFFKNSLIYVYTMDGVYVYEPFSIHKAHESYNYFRTSFATPEEFVDFAYELLEKSNFEKDVDFVRTDRIITLSTCTNVLDSERYALHGKLVQVIN